MINKKLRFVIIICTILIGTNIGYTKDEVDLPHMQLIPLPQEVVQGKGVFNCTPEIAILINSSDLKSEIVTLQKTFVKTFGKPVKVIESESKRNGKLKNEIYLEISNSSNDLETFGSEGYFLEVQKKGIKVTAATREGIFYGLQTLRQLILLSSNDKNNKGVKINCVNIRDKAKFEWRGVMLDPGRYFLPIEFLKEYINAMALYKMNRLHLHLTDDHGWTVELETYPELINQDKWPDLYKPRHNGHFYSKEQLKDLVDYAKERHIVIMPEFDQPGHNTILALVKPEILCDTNPYRNDLNALADFPNEEKASAPVRAQLEGCVGKEETLKVYENILTEFMSIFPSKYIHIGGDEYHGFHWANCDDCQSLIKEKGLIEKYDSKELQDLFVDAKGDKMKYVLYLYLMNYLADFVTSKGRIPVIWDDLAFRGNFPKKSMVMQWHFKGGWDHWQRIETPENPAAEAALAGHNAMVARNDLMYFNYDGPLEDVYFFDPMPEGLADEAKKFILGPNACVWNSPPESVVKKSFPRFYALSQMGWSKDENKDFEDFEERTKIHNLKILTSLSRGVLKL